MVFSLIFVWLSGHRVDTELSDLKTKLEGMSGSPMSSNADSGQMSEETTIETIEVSLLLEDIFFHYFLMETMELFIDQYKKR